MSKRTLLFIAAAAALSLTSCRKDETFRSQDIGDVIGFTSYTERPRMKAAVTDITASSLDTFRVMSYNHSDYSGYFASVQKATKQTSGTYGTYFTTDITYYWPSTGTALDFFAWSGEGAGTLTNTSGVASIPYTVPAGGVTDFVVSSATNCTKGPETGGTGTCAQGLTFSHALTKVNSVTLEAKDDGTSNTENYKFIFTDIHIDDAKTSATYTFNPSGTDPNWGTPESTTADYVFTESSSHFTGDVTKTLKHSATVNDQFIILPQTVTFSITYSVQYSPDGTNNWTEVMASDTKTVNVPMEMGKAYDITFQLSNDASPIIFSVSGVDSWISETYPQNPPSAQVLYIRKSTTSPIELDETGTVNLSFVTDPADCYTGSKLEIRCKDGGSSPSTVQIDGCNFSGGSGLELTINLPDTRVEVDAITLNTVKCESAGTKLFLAGDASVTNMNLTGGDVAVKGSVNTVTITAENVTSEADIAIGTNDEAKVEHINNENLQTTVNVSCPSGKEPVDKQEVVAGSVVYKIGSLAVAKIGSTTYATLAHALALVENGQTIVMLKDDTDKGLTSPHKNYTIDFNGHSFTGKPGGDTVAFKCGVNDTILFKNGSIKCHTTANKTAANGITQLIRSNGSNLTFYNFTIDGTYLKEGDGRCLASFSGGSVEIKGNTNIKGGTTAYGFEMDNSSSVTWNSTGLVKGAVRLNGGTLTIAKNFRANAPIIVASDANLVLNAKISTSTTYYTMEGTDDAVVLVKDSGNLSISGSESGFITAGSSQNYGVKVVSDNGGLTMNGGTIQGTATGMYISAGTVALNGGEISGGTSDAIAVANSSAAGSEANVHISSTTLTSTSGSQVGATYSAPATAIANIWSTDNTLTTSGSFNWVPDGAQWYKLH